MNALEIKNVSKSFSGHQALHDISLEVPEQTIFGLLGPNGAGKTTLIRIVNQIIRPDSGEVNLFGECLKPDHVFDIGYLPEERGLYKKMKVGEQAMYLAQLKGLSASEARKKLTNWFERFDIAPWWNKKVEELSKGMAQKIQFITTVLHEPKLLILDEPFSGFDPINVEIITQEILRLRDNGATIILSTHNMSSVEELCDHIGLINNSRLVLSGPLDEVRNQFARESYKLTFKGNIIAFTNALWTNYELITKSSNDDIHSCEINLLNGARLNDLLNTVLPVIEIVEVKPIIPSMHDIFIEAVEGTQKHEEA
ncbi:MAG: ATP-binding cassette domain-containing protein [Flavobacteriales bacterium]|nr:ATP-binding cassette domain-containing protein [Flavobacteriales bacterium]